MEKLFGATSTTDDVLDGVDLVGKSFLVTGVSAGLGVETARALVERGAAVLGTARDITKAEAATSAIHKRGSGSGGSLQLMQMDLASLQSVRHCAETLLNNKQEFDAIIANAGVMACPQGRTQDGFETQFGTNHLGHFLFINRIASLMKSGGRLIILSSSGHRISDVELEDPNFERTPYDRYVAYGRSKTANSLFAVEFDHRHKHKGVRAAALHPGAIQTELSRYMTQEDLDLQVRSINEHLSMLNKPALMFKTVPQGAATTVWATVVAAPEQIGGRFCEDCQVAEIDESEESFSGVRAYALDRESAKALWMKSEEMVGERFDNHL